MKSWVSILFLLMVTSCGRNDGIPLFGGKKRNGDAVATNNGELSLTGNDRHWGLKVNWLVGPRMGSEDGLIENKMELHFLDATSENPLEVSDVQVVAWMPVHGHDTGNQKPHAVIGSGGMVSVDNIYFIMTGAWQVIVRASSQDTKDEVRFNVDIKE